MSFCHILCMSFCLNRVFISISMSFCLKSCLSFCLKVSLYFFVFVRHFVWTLSKSSLSLSSICLRIALYLSPTILLCLSLPLHLSLILVAIQWQLLPHTHRSLKTNSYAFTDASKVSSIYHHSTTWRRKKCDWRKKRAFWPSSACALVTRSTTQASTLLFNKFSTGKSGASELTLLKHFYVSVPFSTERTLFKRGILLGSI